MSESNRDVQAVGRRRDGLLTTGDMARRSRSTLRKVRFYEEAGLVEPVQRTEGGHRLYRESELEKLRFVADLRTAGFSLEEIRELLGTKQRAGSGADASRDLCTRLDQQVRAMSERAALLTRLAAELSATRDLLGACAQCARHDLFPQGCGSCETMTRHAQLPVPAAVLWGVQR